MYDCILAKVVSDGMLVRDTGDLRSHSSLWYKSETPNIIFDKTIFSFLFRNVVEVCWYRLFIYF